MLELPAMNCHYYKSIFHWFNDDNAQYKLRGNNSESGMMAYSSYILEQLSPNLGSNILDLGCGDGKILQKIIEIRPDLECFGLDISPKLIKQAIDDNCHCHFEVGNVLDIRPFKRKFDIIFSFGLAQYIKHNDFIELNRTLLTMIKDDGMVCHLSIPDNRKKNIAILNVLSEKHSTFLSILILLFVSLFFKYKFFKDGSLWHNPIKLVKVMNSFSHATIRFPADLWYRFNMIIIKK